MNSLLQFNAAPDRASYSDKVRPLAFLMVILTLMASCEKPEKYGAVYETEYLKIIQLTENSFQHITYLQTSDFGKVACNGLVYINRGEAAVFDTPSEDQASEQLIKWIEEEKQASVAALIVNHFHNDCLGGIRPFHEKDIPSYANEHTIVLAKRDSMEAPLNGFSLHMELQIGGSKILNEFHGHAHAPDNIVSYIPSENLLFGGCMMKSLKAGKGYLGDADTVQWPVTIGKIDDKWPDLEIVVPGHGAVGGPELLAYTIKLFSTTDQ